jgi:hypothetical protein
MSPSQQSSSVVKSCFNCPSLLPANDSTFFRKSLGVPVCARFGKPIGRVNSSREETESLARHFASNCEEFGKPKPAVPDWDEAKFLVAFPDVDVTSENQERPELVSSCAACKYFVNEVAVARDLGWTTGLCSAKGKLLLSNRYTLEARSCGLKSYGITKSDTYGITYLPEYEDNFSGSGDPVREYQKELKNFIDPAEYETDKPVSEEDANSGIRAWRKVNDPLSGNCIFLPIFDRNFFSESEQEKIPKTGDDEHPEDYIDHNFYRYRVGVLWTELDETPAFWGKSGIGKTEFFRHMAWLMCLPFERFSITGSTELDDLAGKMHFTEGEGTHFEYGRLPLAWKKPSVMVIDEPNTGPPDVWQFLRPLTDNSKQLVLDMNSGERISRHNDCYLGMAMNPTWDILNVGTQMIGDADANRLMHLYVDLPPASLEREIIKKRCIHDGFEISDSSLDMMMAIAEDIRALSADGTLPISWAIRPQLKVARALRWFDPMTSYQMGSADYLEPEARDMLLDVVRSHIDSVF